MVEESGGLKALSSGYPRNMPMHSCSNAETNPLHLSSECAACRYAGLVTRCRLADPRAVRVIRTSALIHR